MGTVKEGMWGLVSLGQIGRETLRRGFRERRGRVDGTGSSKW